MGAGEEEEGGGGRTRAGEEEEEAAACTMMESANSRSVIARGPSPYPIGDMEERAQ